MYGLEAAKKHQSNLVISLNMTSSKQSHLGKRLMTLNSAYQKVNSFYKSNEILCPENLIL